MPKWCRVAATSELAPGEGRCVVADGRSLALFNVDGAFHAIDNTCLHAGGPLGEGDLQGFMVLCPWHGWGFDVRSGEASHDPDQKVECFPVRVEGDDVLVQLAGDD